MKMVIFIVNNLLFSNLQPLWGSFEFLVGIYRFDINIDVGALRADGDSAESEIEDRGHIPAETTRRMACDCSVVHWQDDVGAGHAGDIVSMAHSYISTSNKAGSEAQRRRLSFSGLYLLNTLCRCPSHPALGRWHHDPARPRYAFPREFRGTES